MLEGLKSRQLILVCQSKYSTSVSVQVNGLGLMGLGLDGVMDGIIDRRLVLGFLKPGPPSPATSKAMSSS